MLCCGEYSNNVCVCVVNIYVLQCKCRSMTISVTAASLVNVFGRIFTVAFDDTPEDPPADIITRLTVGNRLCNHVDENGEL